VGRVQGEGVRRSTPSLFRALPVDSLRRFFDINYAIARPYLLICFYLAHAASARPSIAAACVYRGGGSHFPPPASSSPLPSLRFPAPALGHFARP